MQEEVLVGAPARERTGGSSVAAGDNEGEPCCTRKGWDTIACSRIINLIWVSAVN